MENDFSNQKVKISPGGGRWGKAVMGEGLKNKATAGERFFVEKEPLKTKKTQNNQTTLPHKQKKIADRSFCFDSLQEDKSEFLQMAILVGLPIAVFVLMWVIYS